MTRRPLVSVIVPTYRLGGIDCLKWSLDHQDYPHLELVLVDALYAQRAKAVQAYFQGAKYPVTHCPPAQLAGEEPPGFRDMCPRYRNTGIQRTSGDLLVFWSDFTLALPQMLALHAQTLQSFGGNKAVVCGTHLYGRPRKDLLVEGSIFEDIDAYEDAIRSFHEDDPRWISIFTIRPEVMFMACCYLADMAPTDLDPKLRVPHGTSIKPHYAHWKNESLPREAVLEVGGFDEFYNDTHCADDMDFACRLAKAGFKFWLDKGNEVVIPNPRPFSPLLRRARPHEEALREWTTERAPEIDAGAVAPRRSILLP